MRFCACLGRNWLHVLVYTGPKNVSKRIYKDKWHTFNIITHFFPHISTGFLITKQNEAHFRNRVFRTNPKTTDNSYSQ
jgi:hypothetical protein